jgi:hypothetical protein
LQYNAIETFNLAQGQLSLSQVERKADLLQEFINTFAKLDPGLTRLVSQVIIVKHFKQKKFGLFF